MVHHALAHLHQRVLGVTGLAGVGEVLVEIGIAQLSAEPGLVPEEKRKQHQRQSKQRDEEVSSSAGAAVSPRSLLWSHRLWSHRPWSHQGLMIPVAYASPPARGRRSTRRPW